MRCIQTEKTGEVPQRDAHSASRQACTKNGATLAPLCYGPSYMVGGGGNEGGELLHTDPERGPFKPLTQVEESANGDHVQCFVQTNERDDEAHWSVQCNGGVFSAFATKHT